MTSSELFFGETIGDTADLQTIIYHFSRFWVCCMLSKWISSFSFFLVSEMKENPMTRYIKFWFCMTFSALFFRRDNRRHFRSGNDNLTFLSKLSLWYASKRTQALVCLSWAKWQRTQRWHIKNFGFVWACWLISGAQVSLSPLLLPWLCWKSCKFFRFSVISVKKNMSTEIKEESREKTSEKNL